MKIPSNNQWTQSNDGNILGILHETHNCTFDQRGEIRLSRKALSLVDSQTTDFSDVMAIVYFDGDYYIVTDGKVFNGDLSGNDFDVVSSSPELGVVSDAVVAYSRLYVSDTTALAYKAAGGGWTTGIGTLTATNPHPLCVFDSLTTYKLAVGDGNIVNTYASDGSLNGTILTLPANYMVTSLVYRNSYLYVGTKEINGGEAAIFVWNGDGTSAQYKIDVGAAWVYSMTPYRSTIAYVTNEGELSLLSGTVTQQLATFPIFNMDGTQWDTNNASRGHIFNRGMVSVGDCIYLNVNGEVDSGHIPEMKSGIWCFDPKVGLHHYTSNTTDLWVSDNFSVSNSVITTSSAHGLIVGDTVVFTTLSGLTGISNSTLYYAIPVSSTTLQVAYNRKDAFDGVAVTITGTKSAGTIEYCPNTNFGEMHGSQAGAIAVTNYLDAPLKLFNSNIIWGAALKNNAGTERSVLSVVSDRYNVAWFSTQRIYTDNIKSVWKSLYPFFTGVYYSVEKIIVKLQQKERPSLPSRTVSGSWVSSNTINTTDLYIKNIIEAGDEVVFADGYGGGRTAHIVSIDTTSSTVVSLVVDEDYGVAAGSSTFYVTGFKKMQTISHTREEDGFSKVTLDRKAPWVQVKVELRGFNPAVSMLELTNSTDKSAM